MKKEMLKRIAAIKLEKLDDIETAVARYSEVLADDPEDVDL